MDKKSIVVIAVCLALLAALNLVVPKLFPPIPVPPGAVNPAVASGTNGAGATVPTMSPAGTAVTNGSATPRLVINTNLTEQLVVVSNENARYTFTSYGGGLKRVELLKFPETVSRKGDGPATNELATLNDFGSTPTLAVLGGDVITGDGIFTLTQTATGVRAEKSLPSGLNIVKEFQLSSNYLVSATVRFENHSTGTLTIPEQEWTVGSATPTDLEDNGQMVGVMWYNGSKSQDIAASYFASGFSCVPRTPRTDTPAAKPMSAGPRPIINSSPSQ